MNGFQEKVIEKAANNIHKLNSWECGFIESLQDKPDNYELSETQNRILNKISEKVY